MEMNDRPVFLVGFPRSGTTLLRLMLHSHPRIAMPHETAFLLEAYHERKRFGDLTQEANRRKVARFVVERTESRFHLLGLDAAAVTDRIVAAPPTLGSALAAVYTAYAERFGKPRWGDKTPLHCREMPFLERLLPEAHFVHLVRDGRDASLSLRRTWFSPGDDVETLARYWRDNVAAARAGGAVVRRFLELRYEDLVAAPEPALRDVCAFLDLPFRAQMLRYPERAPGRLAEHRERKRPDGSLMVSREERLRQQALTLEAPRASRVGVWRLEMGREEALRFEAIAGDLLAAYGYPVAGAG
jgi:hypothetical protein